MDSHAEDGMFIGHALTTSEWSVSSSPRVRAAAPFTQIVRGGGENCELCGGRTDLSHIAVINTLRAKSERKGQAALTDAQCCFFVDEVAVHKEVTRRKVNRYS